MMQVNKSLYVERKFVDRGGIWERRNWPTLMLCEKRASYLVNLEEAIFVEDDFAQGEMRIGLW